MGAEVGGGGGANINVIPKTGGNTVKGSAQWSITGKGYWDGFTGNNITDDLRAQGITDPTLRNLNDFNADAGGPFIKDRLWWFGSFRNYSTVEATPSYTIVNADGTLTNPFDSNLRNYTASGKYQVNKSNALSAFWTYNRKFQPNRNAGAVQPNPINTLHQESPKNLINANWTSVFGQNTFLEVSSTYFHMHWPSTWADEFNALPADQQRPTTFNVTSGIYIDGPEPTGQRFRDAYRHQTNIGMTRYIDGFLGASHQLKTGFENWWTPTGTDGFQIFDDSRLRYTGSADTCNQTVRSGCVPSEVFLYNTPLTQETQMRNFAAFVQDRASYGRVTLNLGLRWSYFDGTIPEQSNGGGKWFPVTTYPEIDPGFKWSTLAPRLGIVYKLTEDGKNVVKASYSRYFESMYTGEFSSINPNSIQTGGVQTWSFLGDLNNNGRAERNELGVLRSQFVPRSNSIDPNLKDPKNDEIMFAYQRELAANWSFNIDYIQRWFSDMTTDQNCYGLPCDQVASTVYTQNRVVADSGPDNLRGTARRPQHDLLRRQAGVPREGHLLPHQLRQQRLGRLRAGLQGGGDVVRQADVEPLADAGLLRVVAPRRRPAEPEHQHDDLAAGRVLRPHQPEQPARLRRLRPRRQRPAARLQDPRQLSGGVGDQRRRQLPGAERPAARSHADRAVRAGLAQRSGRGARHVSLQHAQPAVAARRQGLPLRRPPRFGDLRGAQRAELERGAEQRRQPDAVVRQPGGVRCRAEDDVLLRPGAGNRRAARAEARVQVRLLRTGTRVLEARG